MFLLFVFPYYLKQLNNIDMHSGDFKLSVRLSSSLILFGSSPLLPLVDRLLKFLFLCSLILPLVGDILISGFDL